MGVQENLSQEINKKIGSGLVVTLGVLVETNEKAFWRKCHSVGHRNLLEKISFAKDEFTVNQNLKQFTKIMVCDKRN